MNKTGYCRLTLVHFWSNPVYNLTLSACPWTFSTCSPSEKWAFMLRTSWQLFGKWPKDKGIRRDEDGISGGCNKTQTFTKSCQEKSSVRTHSWDFCSLFSPLVCCLENIPDPLPDHQPGTAPSSPSLLHHSWLNTAEWAQHTLLKTSQTKPLANANAAVMTKCW